MGKRLTYLVDKNAVQNTIHEKDNIRTSYRNKNTSNAHQRSGSKMFGVSVLNKRLSGQYPLTWTTGLSLAYQLGRSSMKVSSVRPRKKGCRS